MNRVPTGINGLDELIEGGFPEGRAMLLAGGCGTGKTVFCMQYIYNGAKKYGEPGIYVTLDERPELLRQDMGVFGWDIRKLEDIDKLMLEIMRVAKRINAKRLVIDSIPALGFNFQSEIEIRNAIRKLSYLLMRIGVTTIMTTESGDQENKFGKFGIEEYVVDGVLVVHYMGIGTRSNRTMHIRKMRATKHSEELHPMTISEKGITIQKVGKEYEEV